MKIAFGADHAAVELKQGIIKLVESLGHTAKDFGTNSSERVNYPDYAKKAAQAVKDGECDLCILVCGSGVGMSIVANKMKGIRAVVCSEPYSAKLSREHNDTNVLCIGARVVGADLAEMIVRAWLSAEFEGGRHAERVAMFE